MQDGPISDALAFADGELDAIFLDRMQHAMGAWAAQRGTRVRTLGELIGLPASPAEYRRQARDTLLRVLALELVRDDMPATRARRVAGFLSGFEKAAWPAWAHLAVAPPAATPAERIAFRLMRLGEPWPGERQLQTVFRHQFRK